ncbi:transposase [Streptomyces hirsutus]
MRSPDGVGVDRILWSAACGLSGWRRSERKPCPSGLSDEQWSLIEPVIFAWKDRRRSVSGRQGAYAMREIVNAILHQGRTGCQWACLPHDLPRKSAT